MIARGRRRSAPRTSVVRQQLGVDVELADAAADELGELAAEVEDDDGPVRRARLAAGDRAAGPVDLGRAGGGASRATSR